MQRVACCSVREGPQWCARACGSVQRGPHLEQQDAPRKDEHRFEVADHAIRQAGRGADDQERGQGHKRAQQRGQACSE